MNHVELRGQLFINMELFFFEMMQNVYIYGIYIYCIYVHIAYFTYKHFVVQLLYVSNPCTFLVESKLL